MNVAARIARNTVEPLEENEKRPTPASVMLREAGVGAAQERLEQKTWCIERKD